VQLQAATALIMGGTGHPLNGPDSPAFVSDYLNGAVDRYISPMYAARKPTGGGVTNAVAVWTPEQFMPVAGLQTFGSSVADGRANVLRCLAGNGCVYND